MKEVVKVCTAKTDDCPERFKASVNFCPHCGSPTRIHAEPFIYIAYVHGDRDTNYELGAEKGLEGDALDEFSRCCYEVGLEIEVDPITGKTQCLGVLGKTGTVYLKEPVEV